MWSNLKMNEIVKKLIEEKGMSWLLTAIISYLRMMPREAYIDKLQKNLEKTLLEYNSRHENE